MSTGDLISTAVSAAFVVFMIGFAALLGFRKAGKLDDAEVSRIAAAEGAHVEVTAVDDHGRTAVAKLAGGKLLVAKVMADGVSARVLGQGQAHVRKGKHSVSLTFGDLGYPSLNMRLENPPAWLTELGAKS